MPDQQVLVGPSDYLELTFNSNVTWRRGLIGWLLRRAVRFMEGERLVAHVRIDEPVGVAVKVSVSEYRVAVRPVVTKDAA